MYKKLFSILILVSLIFGCSFIDFKSNSSKDILNKIAISVASKKLGEQLYNSGIRWNDTEENFYQYIIKHGLSIDTSNIVVGYAIKNISPLYKDELEQLVQLAGIEITVDGYNIDESNYPMLMLIINGVRDGIKYQQDQHKELTIPMIQYIYE